MQPQQSFGDSNQGAIVCAQCGSPMPNEMRFCRSCGNRLGEGPAEYTETVRFSNAASANAQFNAVYVPPSAAPISERSSCDFTRRRRRLGFGGVTWIWIVLGVCFSSGGERRVHDAPQRVRRS